MNTFIHFIEKKEKNFGMRERIYDYDANDLETRKCFHQNKADTYLYLRTHSLMRYLYLQRSLGIRM